MENMCRLCLENKHLIDVFNLSDCDLLSEMIFATSGVLILTTDSITKKICTRCYSIVLKVNRFRDLAVTVNQLLHDKYESKPTALLQIVENNIEFTENEISTYTTTVINEAHTTTPTTDIVDNVLPSTSSPLKSKENDIKILKIESLAANKSLEIEVDNNKRPNETSLLSSRTPRKKKRKIFPDDSSIICPICNTKLAHARQYAVHFAIHRKCEPCNITFSKIRDMTRHIKKNCPYLRKAHIPLTRLDHDPILCEKYSISFPIVVPSKTNEENIAANIPNTLSNDTDLSDGKSLESKFLTNTNPINNENSQSQEEKSQHKKITIKLSTLLNKSSLSNKKKKSIKRKNKSDIAESVESETASNNSENVDYVIKKKVRFENQEDKDTKFNKDRIEPIENEQHNTPDVPNETSSTKIVTNPPLVNNENVAFAHETDREKSVNCKITHGDPDIQIEPKSTKQKKRKLSNSAVLTTINNSPNEHILDYLQLKKINDLSIDEQTESTETNIAETNIKETYGLTPVTESNKANSKTNVNSKENHSTSEVNKEIDCNSQMNNLQPQAAEAPSQLLQINDNLSSVNKNVENDKKNEITNDKDTTEKNKQPKELLTNIQEIIELDDDTNSSLTSPLTVSNRKPPIKLKLKRCGNELLKQLLTGDDVTDIIDLVADTSQSDIINATTIDDNIIIIDDDQPPTSTENIKEINSSSIAANEIESKSTSSSASVQEAPKDIPACASRSSVIITAPESSVTVNQSNDVQQTTASLQTTSPGEKVQSGKKMSTDDNDNTSKSARTSNISAKYPSVVRPQISLINEKNVVYVPNVTQSEENAIKKIFSGYERASNVVVKNITNKIQHKLPINIRIGSKIEGQLLVTKRDKGNNVSEVKKTPIVTPAKTVAVVQNPTILKNSMLLAQTPIRYQTHIQGPLILNNIMNSSINSFVCNALTSNSQTRVTTNNFMALSNAISLRTNTASIPILTTPSIRPNFSISSPCRLTNFITNAQINDSSLIIPSSSVPTTTSNSKGILVKKKAVLKTVVNTSPVNTQKTMCSNQVSELHPIKSAHIPILSIETLKLPTTSYLRRNLVTSFPKQKENDSVKPTIVGLRESLATAISKNTITNKNEKAAVNLSPTTNKNEKIAVNLSPAMNKNVKTVVNLSPTTNKNEKTVVTLPTTMNKNVKTVVNLSPTMKKNEKTVVNLSPAMNKNVKTVVNLSPTMKKNEKTVVNLSPTMKKNEKITVNLSPAMNKNVKTVVNLSPTMNKNQKAAVNLPPTIPIPTSNQPMLRVKNPWEINNAKM